MVRREATPRVSIHVAHAVIRGRPSLENASSRRGEQRHRAPAGKHTVLAMRRSDRHIVAAMRTGAFVFSERRGGGAVVMMFP